MREASLQLPCLQRLGPPSCSMSQSKATPKGFEPLRAEPNGFLVHLLSHSDKVSVAKLMISGIKFHTAVRLLFRTQRPKNDRAPPQPALHLYSRSAGAEGGAGCQQLRVQERSWSWQDSNLQSLAPRTNALSIRPQDLVLKAWSGLWISHGSAGPAPYASAKTLSGMSVRPPYPLTFLSNKMRLSSSYSNRETRLSLPGLEVGFGFFILVDWSGFGPQPLPVLSSGVRTGVVASEYLSQGPADLQSATEIRTPAVQRMSVSRFSTRGGTSAVLVAERRLKGWENRWGARKDIICLNAAKDRILPRRRGTACPPSLAKSLPDQLHENQPSHSAFCTTVEEYDCLLWILRILKAFFGKDQAQDANLVAHLGSKLVFGFILVDWRSDLCAQPLAVFSTAVRIWVASPPLYPLSYAPCNACGPRASVHGAARVLFCSAERRFKGWERAKEKFRKCEELRHYADWFEVGHPLFRM